MTDREEPKQGFKVEDKRRFDASGNERNDAGEVASGQGPSGPVTSDGFVVKDAVEEGHEREIDFSSFLMSLASQVMMQLGEIAPPPGVPITRDLAGARQTIEILEMLKVKTQGNLDEFETKLFEDILHSLKLSFVKAANR